MKSQPAAIDLYWLPLGAGGHSVRLNGKVFEWFAARFEHRDRCDLYHSAFQVYTPEGRFVIEQAPAWGEGSRRGVVAEGIVGARALGRFRLFRYEIRSWREGIIPDIAEAVESPRGNGLILGYMMYRTQLVPRPWTWLGLIGGPLIIISGTIVLFGGNPADATIKGPAALPEALWELFLGVYCTIWGFRRNAPDPLRKRVMTTQLTPPTALPPPRRWESVGPSFCLARVSAHPTLRRPATPSHPLARRLPSARGDPSDRGWQEPQGPPRRA